MNNQLTFISEVLQDNLYAKGLFACETLFEHSDYKEAILSFSDYDKNMTNQDELLWFEKREFIGQKTDWLYVDFNGNLYGLLNYFVIKLDDEGSFFYFCHGIQNLPYFLYQKNSEVWRQKREYFANKSGTTYHDLYQQYLDICQKYHYIINSTDKHNEFDQFVFEENLNIIFD
jgi:hypothetical protein